MSDANHTTDENFKIVVALCVARVLASIYIIATSLGITIKTTIFGRPYIVSCPLYRVSD